MERWCSALEVPSFSVCRLTLLTNSLSQKGDEILGTYLICCSSSLCSALHCILFSFLWSSAYKVCLLLTIPCYFIFFFPSYVKSEMFIFSGLCECTVSLSLTELVVKGIVLNLLLVLQMQCRGMRARRSGACMANDGTHRMCTTAPNIGDAQNRLALCPSLSVILPFMFSPPRLFQLRKTGQVRGTSAAHEQWDKTKESYCNLLMKEWRCDTQAEMAYGGFESSTRTMRTS